MSDKSEQWVVHEGHWIPWEPKMYVLLFGKIGDESKQANKQTENTESWLYDDPKESWRYAGSIFHLI